jgi:hypothetical protein
MMKKVPLFVTVFLLSLNGCDQSGLNPNEFQEPGFSGRITIAGAIPPRDSLRDLRVVAVPYYPVDTTVADLIDKILNKQIIPFSGSLSDNVSANSILQYQLFVKPKKYEYVAVAQLYGNNIFQDWRVVGIFGYSKTNPTPAPVIVVDGEMTKDVNITVDFYDLPPQPFKK